MGPKLEECKDKWTLLKVFMRTIYIWLYKHGPPVWKNGARRRVAFQWEF